MAGAGRAQETSWFSLKFGPGDKLWRGRRIDKRNRSPGGTSTRMTQDYKSSERIPASGIYRVIHAQHRLPHEVTLIEGQVFPPCAKCQDEVRFELVRVLPSLERERRGSVSLYALPVIEEEEDATK